MQASWLGHDVNPCHRLRLGAVGALGRPSRGDCSKQRCVPPTVALRGRCNIGADSHRPPKAAVGGTKSRCHLPQPVGSERSSRTFLSSRCPERAGDIAGDWSFAPLGQECRVPSSTGFAGETPLHPSRHSSTPSGQERRPCHRVGGCCSEPSVLFNPRLAPTAQSYGRWHEESVPPATKSRCHLPRLLGNIPQCVNNNVQQTYNAPDTKDNNPPRQHLGPRVNGNHA